MDKTVSGGKTLNIISIFEKEIAGIQNEIENYEKGHPNHIAVISEPYSGADYIFDKITGDNSQRIENIKFLNPVKNTDFFTNFYIPKDIILLRSCQYLYTRKTGGFDVFESFLDILASTDKLFVTGWNLFAWNYLNNISDIGNLFPVKIRVPELDSKSLMNLIMSHMNEKITFIDDRNISEAQNIFLREKCRINIPLSQKKPELHYIKFNLKALFREKKVKSMQEVENEVFQKIARLAGGKYDVAQKIWKKSVKDNEVRLSKIPEPQLSEMPDFNESFVLGIILSMESVGYDELVLITGTEIQPERLLYRLIRGGLIEEYNQSYKINPEAVNLIIAHLKKIRMVW